MSINITSLAEVIKVMIMIIVTLIALAIGVSDAMILKNFRSRS